MPVTDIAAPDLVWEVRNEGDTEWIAIGGISNTSHSPTEGRANTNKYGTQREESLIIRRGDSFTLEGFYQEDEETGARDPGQVRIQELASEVGQAAKAGEFRLTTPGGNGIQFNADCSHSHPSGGENDAAAWSVTLTVQGDITEIEAS